jgi:hypothetical protein
MSKFITGTELEQAVYDIIWNAQKILLIVSPYIKLDNYFKLLFENHVNNPNIHILIVFGKNEGHVSRSLSKSDFDFFKKFLNVSVVYLANLHGKYYGNEKAGLLTSINLYDYSFKNNVEFAVYSQQSVLDNIVKSADDTAFDTCFDLASNGEAVYIKRPVFQKTLFSSILGRNYIKSDVLYDVTEKYYGYKFQQKSKNTIKRLTDFPTELELGTTQAARPERQEVETKKPTEASGYCIRTGHKIPFNPKRPYSEKAFASWVYYSNVDFPEAYCHKTGQPSYGKTSMRKPIIGN